MVASFRSHQGVLPWLALPGSTVPLIAVSLAIAVGCLVARRPHGVILAVTAVPVTAFLDDTVLKHLVDRTHFGQLSFPSGHTASAMTLATVLGVLLHDPARRTATRMARAALVVAACAVTALVAVGVIGLRWHYFTDTVGGVALGTGTVLALALLIDLAPGPLRSRASALLSRRRPTSRYRSAPAGRRAPARESPPGASHAATGTRVALLPRLHRPARQHVRP
jgi:membrane-associated phospholipid phosphatase